jgi:hypothetical protein
MDACRISPASTPSAVTVAAHDASWQRWSMANWWVMVLTTRTPWICIVPVPCRCEGQLVCMFCLKGIVCPKAPCL